MEVESKGLSWYRAQQAAGGASHSASWQACAAALAHLAGVLPVCVLPVLPPSCCAWVLLCATQWPATQALVASSQSL